MHPVILFTPMVFLTAALLVAWKKNRRKIEIRERRRQRLLRVMVARQDWVGVDLANGINANGDVEPVSQGTLYPLLHGLELDGLVRMHPDPQASRFSLTPKGREQAEQHLAPLDSFIAQ